MITDELILSGLKCPYCGKKTDFVDSAVIYGRSYGMIYLCKPCRAYVGCHEGTAQAKGRLADAELREWKKRAHHAFDPIWQNRKMRRKQAYAWLSEQMGISVDYTHIGMFDVEECKKVIEVCKEFKKDRK